MKRRSFLTGSLTIPALGAGIATAAVIDSDTSLRQRIEHHIAEVRSLIEQTMPEGVGDSVCIIRPDSWDVQAIACHSSLNPTTLRWS